MPRAGLYALLSLVAFALVFALWPGQGGVTAQTGAQLSGVRLELYPARDPDAVWRFDARQVLHDPVNSETRLSGISGGERWIAERVRGLPTGRQVLDARISAADLTIDGRDDLTTRQATITLIKECADVDLTAQGERPVRIEQGVGFSAPLSVLRAPSMNVRVPDLSMDFQFNILSAGRMELVGDLDAPEKCVDGVRVPRG